MADPAEVSLRCDHAAKSLQFLLDSPITYEKRCPKSVATSLARSRFAGWGTLTCMNSESYSADMFKATQLAAWPVIDTLPKRIIYHKMP